MATTSPYFPCALVEQTDDYSVICSDLHYFDEFFGDSGSSGYAIERLAKKLVREHSITGVKFDSEAGMFCAYSNRKTPLKKLCTKLRLITGSERKHLAEKQLSEPTISLDKAEQLLLKGFVLSLDEKAQKQFLKHVPYPATTVQQKQLLQQIQDGTAEEKIRAAKKINSEARTLVRKWDHYLSHPTTTRLFLDCCDANEEDPKVYQELIWALVFICDRHLPDLRAKQHFLNCLNHKTQRVRQLGIWGLDKIRALTPTILQPLLADKSGNVRQSAEEHLEWIGESNRPFASWLFDEANIRKVRKG